MSHKLKLLYKSAFNVENSCEMTEELLHVSTTLRLNTLTALLKPRVGAMRTNMWAKLIIIETVGANTWVETAAAQTLCQGGFCVFLTETSHSMSSAPPSAALRFHVQSYAYFLHVRISHRKTSYTLHCAGRWPGVLVFFHLSFALITTFKLTHFLRSCQKNLRKSLAQMLFFCFFSIHSRGWYCYRT